MLYIEHSKYIVHTDSNCNECVHQWLWSTAQLRSYYFFMCVWICGCVYALVNEKMDMDVKVTLPEHSKCMDLLSMCISVCGWVGVYMRLCVWVRGCI